MPFAATRDAVPRNARRPFELESTVNPLSIPALLRCDAVTLLTGLSPDELEREVKNGLFPPPVKLTPDGASDAVGWNSCEIAVVNAAKTCGATAEQLRQLVSDQLYARRLLAPTMFARPQMIEQPSTRRAN